MVNIFQNAFCAKFKKIHPCSDCQDVGCFFKLYVYLHNFPKFTCMFTLPIRDQKVRMNLAPCTLVFCHQNCSDLLWEKNCSSDQEKLLKIEAEGQEFAKILRSLEQFIQSVKGQNNFW